MIISHKYKIIFIHIYKTAGTFIVKLLKNLDPDCEDIYGHISAKEAKKRLNSEIWDNYTTFCVVRNSWDWQMSLYFYMKGWSGHSQHHIIKNMNVSEYLRWRETDLSQQTSFILDDDNNCLIDKILSFENLTDDLKLFFKETNQIDITPNLPKQKLNTSKRDRDYKIYYNNLDIELLSKLHKPDINYFNFKFQ